MQSIGTEVPEELYTIPLGRADIKREGSDVTVVATSLMVHKALAAADQMANEGVSVEVVDPRSLVPLDRATIVGSVEKTRRAVVASEDCYTGGITAELAALIAAEAFDYLDAPVERVAAFDTPIPFAPACERDVIPQMEDIVAAIHRTLDE
jgi:pyruvate/2-oxoglutarate/acetoin dehydrogenase E1 component